MNITANQIKPSCGLRFKGEFTTDICSQIAHRLVVYELKAFLVLEFEASV
jgi:hypothetical protein